MPADDAGIVDDAQGQLRVLPDAALRVVTVNEDEIEGAEVRDEPFRIELVGISIDLAES